jgi:hypothetical protein
MSLPVRIETLVSPLCYTAEQLELAARLAQLLGRGRLVLCEKPAG